jgi:hypothetical protein
MTSALDNLIAAALKSDDPKLRALAKKAMAETYRKPGRPSVLSADDPDAIFIVFCGIHARNYTDVVFWRGVDRHGKSVVDPEWPDGEPVAITEPSIDPTDAIARELVKYAGCSLTTARKFANEQIKVMADNLEAELATKGVKINMRDCSTKAKIAALKAAKKDHTNN